MAIGPVQLLVLGFDKPNFKGEILAEFDRLRDSDTVRMIDGLAVIKDANGDVTVLQRSDLTEEQKAEVGATVGALVGLGAGGVEAPRWARWSEPSLPPRAERPSTRMSCGT